jgi:telomere length regulation protein
MSREYLSSVAISYDDARWWQSDASLVSATAGMIKLIVADEESRKSQLVSWLSSPSGAGIGEGAAIRRAAVAALAIDKTAVETILDKSLQQFGDQLYIRHTSVMQQEGMKFFLSMYTEY